MTRSQKLSDFVKATAVTNAFAATGQPVHAAITGAAAAAGIAVDVVTQKLHERREKNKS